MTLGFSQLRFMVDAKGMTNNYILVEKPVEGKYFPMQPEQVQEGKKNKFLIESNDNVPGFLKINFGNGQIVKIFLEQGKTNSLKVDINNFEKSLKFDGPQADQNKFLNELKREPIFLNGHENLASRSIVQIESTKPKDFYLETIDLIEAEINILQKKSKKKFSPVFIQAMQKEITFYYLSQFHQSVASLYKKALNDSSSSFSEKWAYYWEKLVEKYPLNQFESAVTEYYAIALDYYISDYRLGHKSEAMYDDLDEEIGEQFLEYDRLIWADFKGTHLEYALAAIFSQRALLGNNEPVLLDLFQKYKNDFPKGDYLDLFEKSVAPIKSISKEKELELPEGIINLEGDKEINSIQELINLFPNKVLYIDVWATWCSPCLFEFRQNKPLEEYAENKDIELVFISVDEIDRKEKWRKTITENNLKGSHLIANHLLKNELIDKFGDGSNLALPHYIIYDKNGKLADGDAKQPSTRSLLLNDLKKHLE